MLGSYFGLVDPRLRLIHVSLWYQLHGRRGVASVPWYLTNEVPQMWQYPTSITKRLNHQYIIGLVYFISLIIVTYGECEASDMLRLHLSGGRGFKVSPISRVV